MSLVLHFHPLSSYCHKVLIALYEKGLPFEGRLLNLGDAAERTAFLDLWPTGKMPLLVDEGRVVPETSVIIDYLERYPGTRMLPDDVDARLEARLWDRLFDQYVMTPMQTIVSDRLRRPEERDPLAVPQAHATLTMSYNLIERHMAGRTWAAGSDFSMADCAAAPSLFYAATLVPFTAEHVNLRAYFERLIARPSVARTLAEAQPYFEFYPFKEALPARFTNAST
ncbi:MAG: glutathione S-transferase family protein [Pseudomonadota bacterium]